jgi:hypothetical protein
MKTIKNHAEHLVLGAAIIGLYVGTLCIGLSWAVRLFN